MRDLPSILSHKLLMVGLASAVVLAGLRLGYAVWERKSLESEVVAGWRTVCVSAVGEARCDEALDESRERCLHDAQTVRRTVVFDGRVLYECMNERHALGLDVPEPEQ